MFETTLLATQETWVSECIAGRGFASEEFTWETRLFSDVLAAFPVLVHKPTQYYFVFGATQNGWQFIEYSPAQNRKIEHDSRDATWKKAQARFRRWLNRIEKDRAAHPGTSAQNTAAAPPAGQVPATLAQQRQAAQAAETAKPLGYDKPFDAREEDYLTAYLDNIRTAFYQAQNATTLDKDYWDREFFAVRAGVAELGRQEWKRRLNDLRWNMSMSLATGGLGARWQPMSEAFTKMLAKVGLND